MIKPPSLSSLIDSAIGDLSMKLINDAEQHTVKDDQGSIRQSLLTLQSAINGAHFDKRTSAHVVDKLKAILKSTEITCAPDFIVFIGRKYPSLLYDLSTDDIFSHRIHHIYRVAEIGSCFSSLSIKTLNHGIDGVRRRVFEISESKKE